jgi:uncharacterized protein with HEPN domain
MNPEERDPGALADMLGSIARIQDYAAGIDMRTFTQVGVVQDAVIRQLTVLGEAANRVSKSLQARSPEIPWRDIIGLRNVIVHQYGKVNPERIWRTLHDELPHVQSQGRTCSLRSSTGSR